MIISGTGRAGTTFLVQMFTALGFDTGFNDVTATVDAKSNAGMEYDLRDPEAPYIVKAPWICDYLDAVLTRRDLVVDRAFVPMRDLFAAAESRREISRRSEPMKLPNGTSGGLWHTDVPDEQERILTDRLYQLIYALARHDVPTTLLYFPRLVQDADYLYAKLAGALGDVSIDRFRAVFRDLARPDLVHDFVQPS
jgi:hypothetical protein